ncbi:MFS general substrate transporter [Dendrothele bispora CBS 962.96]|uniref:MFS general substrate transporter n=1 Tax=Dendrothele bispora (strain CBS 962.96) TaxID=1314807 RepID=A0A4S8MH08_DENBC|nr:MFS general substrate transporter [Dendrothele bispora CBS 962.96]
MSILVLIYIFNYIDRNNVAAARLEGFEEDLGLTGSQYASILSVLYIAYCMMQVPSNIFILDTKPSKYLPSCMVVWGIMSVCTGFTTNFFGALCTRFLIGFVEAAFFPGALFLIAKWYKQNELSQRTAYLTSGSLVANATGSLIASGILKVMGNALGIAAWRWLFFVEGSLTVAVAIWALFVLPDFPESPNPWLTPGERAISLKRIKKESHDPDHVSPRGKVGPFVPLIMAVSDWKVWYLAVTTVFLNLSLSFNAYFPSIAATLEFSPTITLLLCVPPWVFATFIAISLSKHSDRNSERCKHISFSMAGGILGFFISMSTMNPAMRYMSLFLMAQSYGGHIIFLAWVSGSLAHPPAKRAVALAIMNTVGSLGNVLGSYIWPKEWGPDYSKSFAICILASSTCIIMCWIFRQHLAGLNADAEKKETEHGLAKGHRYLL